MSEDNRNIQNINNINLYGDELDQESNIDNERGVPVQGYPQETPIQGNPQETPTPGYPQETSIQGYPSDLNQPSAPQAQLITPIPVQSDNKENASTSAKDEEKLNNSIQVTVKIDDEESSKVTPNIIVTNNSDKYMEKLPDIIPLEPINIICPYCNKPVTTNVNEVPTNFGMILCLILCCFTCICCIWILCMDSIWEIVHECPECKNEIAKRKKKL
eukprot:jgi/Orpsp1_1/1174062/evm.model.c7180000048789.1